MPDSHFASCPCWPATSRACSDPRVDPGMIPSDWPLNLVIVGMKRQPVDCRHGRYRTLDDRSSRYMLPASAFHPPLPTSSKSAP
jgi:hypothetical protein